MQPTQNYSWNFKAAVLSKHLSLCGLMHACQYLSFIILSHKHSQTILTQAVSQLCSHTPHTFAHEWSFTLQTGRVFFAIVSKTGRISESKDWYVCVQTFCLSVLPVGPNLDPQSSAL